GAPLMPAWFPEGLRGFVPVTTFNIWLRLQRNSFQRLGLQTVFKRPWENAWSRWVEKLPTGLSKREPFYRAYRCLEPLFFLQLATPSAVTLWPWLSGSAHIDFFA